MTPICRDGRHDLVEIYSAGGDMECDVVRWCRECGAIVVDVDSDGRTNPGRLRVMEFPRITREAIPL